MVTQRLTPSEAKALANALTSYANDINEFGRNYKMAKGKDFMRRNIQLPNEYYRNVKGLLQGVSILLTSGKKVPKN